MSNKSTAIVATMGIDIGKNSFHVVGLDGRGAIVPAGRDGPADAMLQVGGGDASPGAGRRALEEQKPPPVGAVLRWPEYMVIYHA
jgi:hypothetical protein